MQRYRRVIIPIFVALKAKGKINSNYYEGMKTIEILLRQADTSASGFNKLDSILHDIDNFKRDVAKYGITESVFMSIYGDLLLYQFLKFYSLIENALITMLLGTTYGKKDQQRVDGSETLGRILDIIKSHYPNQGLDSILDRNFRWVLAHGWYHIENETLVYFEDASFTIAHTMDEYELLLKFRLLNLFVIELVQDIVNADWSVPDEGSN